MHVDTVCFEQTENHWSIWVVVMSTWLGAFFLFQLRHAYSFPPFLLEWFTTLSSLQSLSPFISVIYNIPWVQFIFFFSSFLNFRSWTFSFLWFCWFLDLSGASERVIARHAFFFLYHFQRHIVQIKIVSASYDLDSQLPIKSNQWIDISSQRNQSNKWLLRSITERVEIETGLRQIDRWIDT